MINKDVAKGIHMGAWFVHSRNILRELKAFRNDMYSPEIKADIDNMIEQLEKVVLKCEKDEPDEQLILLFGDYTINKEISMAIEK